MDDVAARAPASDLDRVARLLGGTKVLRTSLRTPFDAHALLLKGLPPKALAHLFDSLQVLRKNAALEKAIGISLRTFQRRKRAPARPLSQEQSGRLWKFAEILARATAILGSQEEAELWLQRRALGLDGRKPVDLIATAAGADLVETYLTRIEYGVYT